MLVISLHFLPLDTVKAQHAVRAYFLILLSTRNKSLYETQTRFTGAKIAILSFWKQATFLLSGIEFHNWLAITQQF